MRLKGLKVGFALTGSHCTLGTIMQEIERLVSEGAEVVPIISETVNQFDTRFGTTEHWKKELRRITSQEIISSIVDAEPIGPGKLFDVVVIAPCTGNTLAKLANGITDTPVLMAAKAQLRNQRPVVIAVSTNDGLSMNARNIGLLLNTKNIYLVPFGQDNPQQKANSLVAHMDLILETIVEALQGRQIQPVLREYRIDG
ncbi:dipicolinate synthase subunit B [Calderihabitans maritimus]|uniref:SpoVFB: dipicolinate synthase subunit B n=1 Tax=Calderihabitans maritimus TaxID=1246530 RepID=A0A1Z5HR35_9FIRM|nr:dipicolinate synthase subunit B [Calderihabitans maritimus]GAW91775.1 spoVFB: dipicolinate synthase subunit B [Calderihabitans maritimus]